MINSIEDFFLNLNPSQKEKLQKKNIHDYSPLFMAILNVTPDSFFDGGKYQDINQIKIQVKNLIEQGADIIDVGGESSRPGAVRLNEKEELQRVLPVVETIREISKIPISIDTYKVKVAAKCIDAGANIINDISAAEESNFEMMDLAIEKNIPIILMHKKGASIDMQKNVSYENIIDEVKFYFEDRLKKIENKISKNNKNFNKIILDVGIGFGKYFEHNQQLIQNLDTFKKEFKLPMLIGLSMKSFIGQIIGQQVDYHNQKNIAERIWGTIGSQISAILNGADIVRVHHVKEMKQAWLGFKNCFSENNFKEKK